MGDDVPLQVSIGVLSGLMGSRSVTPLLENHAPRER